MASAAGEIFDVVSGVKATPRGPRRERHEVHVELEVTGAPVIDDKGALCTKRPIVPSIAKLTYERHGDRWTVAATVYGLPVGGGLLNGWAVFRSWRRFEEWPEWLRTLADQQHPSRPGGWPGDDPEGSYL
jgi:hypothetical protein